MPIQVVDLEAWVQRIRDNAEPRFHTVERAADQLEAIERAPAPRDAAAYILEPSFAGGSSPNAAGRVTQSVNYEIGILIAVRHYADAAGGKASAKSRQYRSGLWAALVGWMPDPNSHAVELSRGAPLRYTDQTIYLLDFFRFQTRITSP